MKKSNSKNIKGKENSKNRLDSIIFHDVDTSNAEEVKKRWSIIRRIFRILVLIVIILIFWKLFS